MIPGAAATSGGLHCAITPKEGPCMHIAQSSLTLLAPRNPSTITVMVTGENEHMTEIIHDICRMAVKHAVEPLQQAGADELGSP